jgi:hypothetical protein
MACSLTEFSVRIADICVRLRLPAKVLFAPIPDVYQAFRCLTPGSANPDVDILVRVEPPPPVQGRLVFSSGTLWRLYDHDGVIQIASFAPALGNRVDIEDADLGDRRGVETPRRGVSAGGAQLLPRPVHSPQMVMDRLAIFRNGFTSGELYESPDFLEARGRATTGVFPLSYPLDELLFINLLGQGRGAELHGCGVSMDGDGLLFIGASGAGKSTISQLMAARPGTVVLSDDRTIVRRTHGRWRVYGTPWHGTARAYSATGAELKGIFVLRHAPTNEARRLTRVQAAAALVARSFPTYWDPAGMKYTLGLVEEITSAMPIYDLGFAPTEACVDFVRGLTAAGKAGVA